MVARVHRRKILKAWNEGYFFHLLSIGLGVRLQRASTDQRHVRRATRCRDDWPCTCRTLAERALADAGGPSRPRRVRNQEYVDLLRSRIIALSEVNEAFDLLDTGEVARQVIRF